MFQQHPQRDVNEPVLLYDGRFRVRSGDRWIEASGSARLRWMPSSGIEFEIEAEEPVGLDLGSLTVELPGFTTTNVVPHSTCAPGSIRAFAAAMEWGGEQRLRSVGFQIVNCPDFITPGPAAVPGDPTAIAGDFGTIQTVGLHHDGWQIRIVAVAESVDRYRELKATGGYAFTHVGQLTRVDGSAFSEAEAKEILEPLRVLLSFARGAACALPIQWGRGEDDEIVWRRFQSPVVDPWRRSHLSWIGKGMHTGGILAELFDPFCRIHKNPGRAEPLGVALHWYRHCNTQSSGLEGSLVLGVAALDVLGALIVDSGGDEAATTHSETRGAAKRLRKLLQALKVRPGIPQKCGGLGRFANSNKLDSCGALVELRNGFVHATDRRRKIVFGSDGKAATLDALQLSLWYQELALLRLLEYRGSYFNRTTATWVGQVEPVPWSKS